MSELNKQVSNTVEIYAENRVSFEPGGAYSSDGTEVEKQIIEIRLLGHFCSLIEASLADIAESNVLMTEEITRTAHQLYTYYEKFIINGVNVFEYMDYYLPSQLAVYHNRPLCGGKMNAAEGEMPTGCPKGWFYDWPGQMSKAFPIGYVVIDKDGPTYRVGVTEHFKLGDNMIYWFELTTIDDCTQLYDKVPDMANEIIDAIMFMKRNEQL